jgi:hypothetical protein
MSSEGWALATEGMERSYARAKEEWRAAALEAVFTACLELEYFTPDVIWSYLSEGQTTREKRALGGIMIRAKNNGWIEPTGRTEVSQRPSQHSNILNVWHSKLYGDPDLQ